MKSMTSLHALLSPYRPHTLAPMHHELLLALLALMSRSTSPQPLSPHRITLLLLMIS